MNTRRCAALLLCALLLHKGDLISATFSAEKTDGKGHWIVNETTACIKARKKTGKPLRMMCCSKDWEEIETRRARSLP